MKNKNCPVCGAENLEEIEKEQTITEPFGGQKIFKIKEYYCKSCKSTGDFFNENENKLQKNITELKQNAIKNILEDFIDNKISLSSIERALELPQRTLTKWKNYVSKPSSTAVALLKLIRIFPWLLEVAENKFNYTTAQKIHMNAAFQRMLKQMNFNRDDFTEVGIVTTAKSTFIYMNIEKSNIQNIKNVNEILKSESLPVSVF